MIIAVRPRAGHTNDLSRTRALLPTGAAILVGGALVGPGSDNATACSGFLLFRWFADWRCWLTIVQPETVIGWHHRGFRLYWRWKWRCGK